MYYAKLPNVLEEWEIVHHYGDTVQLTNGRFIASGTTTYNFFLKREEALEWLESVEKVEKMKKEFDKHIGSVKIVERLRAVSDSLKTE